MNQMEQQHSKHLLMTQFSNEPNEKCKCSTPARLFSRYKDQVSKCVYVVTEHMVVTVKMKKWC